MPVTRHPPYRSQACGTTALGSCLRSNAETLILVMVQPAQCEFTASLLLVLCSVQSRLLPATVCWSPLYEHNSPWPKDFSPRIPPVVGHFWLYTFVHSLHRYYSSVRLPKSVHVGRAALAFPDRTGCIPQPITLRISRFPCRELAYMHQFYDSADPARHLR